VLGDERIEDRAPPLLQGGERAGFILFDETAVPDDVGGEDRGEAALDAFFGHARGCHPGKAP
jgi:hypothetical protein